MKSHELIEKRTAPYFPDAMWLPFLGPYVRGALAKATEALRAFGEAVRHSKIDVAEYEED